MKKMGVVFFLMLCAGPSWASAFVGEYTFNDNAFATTLISSFGTFTTSGGSLSDVLTDKDAGTYAYPYLPPGSVRPASVTLGFASCYIVNGPNADIVLFELGVEQGKFLLKLNDKINTYLTMSTGKSAGGYPLNAVAIDLDDYGIPSGARLNSLWVGADGYSFIPAFSLVGALHSIPVPLLPSGCFFAPVLGVLMGIKRRFFTTFR